MEEKENTPSKIKDQKQKRIIALFGAILISALIIYFKDYFTELGDYGYLGIFVLSVIGNATVILPVPVVLTAFIGGGVFNPLLVGLIIGIGSTLGETTGYLAGYGGKIMIEDSRTFKKLAGWIKTRGFLTIFILALIPNPIFDLAGIVSGATNYPIEKFYQATLLGKTIRYLAISYLGASFI